MLRCFSVFSTLISMSTAAVAAATPDKQHKQQQTHKHHTEVQLRPPVALPALRPGQKPKTGQPMKPDIIRCGSFSRSQTL